MNHITEFSLQTFPTMTYNIQNIQINFSSDQFMSHITELLFETFPTMTCNIQNIQIKFS